MHDHVVIVTFYLLQKSELSSGNDVTQTLSVSLVGSKTSKIFYYYFINFI